MARNKIGKSDVNYRESLYYVLVHISCCCSGHYCSLDRRKWHAFSSLPTHFLCCCCGPSGKIKFLYSRDNSIKTESDPIVLAFYVYYDFKVFSVILQMLLGWQMWGTLQIAQAFLCCLKTTASSYTIWLFNPLHSRLLNIRDPPSRTGKMILNI